MSARLRDGWIEVDCDADHMAHVHLALGASDPQPAFRGYGQDGQRTAKIRPPTDLTVPTRVRVIVDGQDTTTATLR